MSLIGGETVNHTLATGLTGVLWAGVDKNTILTYFGELFEES